MVQAVTVVLEALWRYGFNAVAIRAPGKHSSALALECFPSALRDTPAAARAWLAAPHTVKNIGATYPGIADAPQIRLAKAHDVVIHLQRVEAAH
ncbi:hypothetical protein [Streptomyces flaveolus]|uniref:hypothetical protein n=1 Tax=Streptomyces flaveolus TaxID=67297 RepID=UPI0036F8BD60